MEEVSDNLQEKGESDYNGFDRLANEENDLSNGMAWYGWTCQWNETVDLYCTSFVYYKHHMQSVSQTFSGY